MSDSRSLITRHIQQFLTEGDEKLLSVSRNLVRMDMARERQQDKLARAYNVAGSTAVRATRLETEASNKATLATRHRAEEALKLSDSEKVVRDNILASARASIQEERAINAATAALTRQIVTQRKAVTVTREQRAGVGGGMPSPRHGIERGHAMLGGAAGILGMGAVFEVGSLINKANEYEQLLSRTQANTGATIKQMRLMDREAKSLGSSLGIGPKGAGEGLLELSKAGFHANQVVAALAPTMRLAKIGGIDVSESAHAMHDAVLPFQMDVKQIGHVSDVMAVAMHRSKASIEDMGNTLSYTSSIAHHAGQTFDTTMAAIEVLGKGGLINSKAGTGLRRILTNLNSPNTRVQGALDDLGLGKSDLYARDQSGRYAHLKQLPDLLGAIQGKLQGFGGVKQQQLIHDLFGQTGMEAGSILLAPGKGGKPGGLQQLRDLLQENKRASAGIGESGVMTKKIMDNAKGSVEKLTGSIEAGAVTLLQHYEPDLQKFAESTAKGIQEFTSDPKKLHDVEQYIGDAASAVGSLVDAATPFVKVGGQALRLFHELPEPVKAGAIEFGLLYLVTRKLAGTDALSALTGRLGGLRGELRALPGEARAASTGLTQVGTAAAGGRRTGRGGAVYQSGRALGASRTTSAIGAAPVMIRETVGRIPRTKVAGGLAGAAALGGLLTPGDIVGGAATGAAAGSMAGPWGALVGGVGGALGSAIMGELTKGAQKKGGDVGAKIGARIAPGVSKELQKVIGDLEDKRRRAVQISLAARSNAGTPWADHNEFADRKKAEAVAASRGRGLAQAKGIEQQAMAHGMRGMTVNDIAGNLMGQMQKMPATARLAAARSVIAWAKGMEDKGELPKGAAARIAKGVSSRYDIADVLAQYGSKGTESLAHGLQSPKAINAARATVRRIGANYDDLPKSAGKSGHAAKVALSQQIDALKAKLDNTNVTGAARAHIKADLAQARVALHDLRVAGTADAQQLKASWDKLAPTFQQTAQAAVDAARTVANQKPAPAAGQGVHRRGGTIRRFAGGGWVPTWMSGGEEYLPPSMVAHYDQVAPGALAAVERMQAPHFGSGGPVRRGYNFGGMVVPGPSDRDGTFVPAQPGGFVLTGHGQQLLGGMLGYAKGGSILHSRRHRFSLGELVRLALTARWGRGDAGTAAAVGMAESSGEPWQVSTNQGPPYSRDLGLWQINDYYNKKDLPKNWPDPLANAKAAHYIWRTNPNGHWRDWTTYNRGMHRKYLARANAMARTAHPYSGADVASSSSGSRTRIKVTDDLHNMTARAASRKMATLRTGSIPDAFSQTFDAARDGERNLSYVGSLLSDITNAAKVRITREKITVPARSSSRASSRASSSSVALGGRLPGHPELKDKVSRIAQLVAHRYGLGVSSTTGGQHAAGSWHYQGRAVDMVGSKMAPAARFLAANPSLYHQLIEGIHQPGLSVKNGRKVGPGFWGSTTWAGHRDHVHLAARRGGFIGMASGGKVPRIGTTKRVARDVARATGKRAPGTIKDLFLASPHNNKAVSDAMTRLLALIGDAEHFTVTRLGELSHSLDASIRSTVAKKSPGGKNVTRAEALIIRRARAVRSAVQAQMGLRAGILADKADLQGKRIDRAQTTFELGLRRDGTDPSSSLGLFSNQRQISAQQAAKEAQRKTLTRALTIAKKAGRAGSAQAKQLRDEIDALSTDINDLAVQKVENIRALLARMAQDRVDSAQFRTDFGSATMQLVGAGQRVMGTDQSAGGMRQMAALELQSVGGLRQLQSAYEGQAKTALAAGDVAGWRQAITAAMNTATDLANAQADAAELIKKAAETEASARTSAADHTVGLDQLSLDALKLQQQIDGTFQGGGAARGAFITSTIIPALTAQIEADKAALQTELQQRGITSDEYRQAQQKLAQDSNAKLQAIVDASQETAANTDPKKVGGTLGFSWGGEGYTDRILTGNAA